ncbi:MAG: dihydroorotate dehydrogenase [Bacilli bacterium]|nr:dihydroorotate dehydrogenase [Bacilli bacterium]
MKQKLQVKFLEKEFKNPVVPASGTFGFGYEFASWYDLNILGSISLKGTTLEPRFGNPLPRIAECEGGLINSVGLQNPGVKNVIGVEIPKLEKVYKGEVFANVGGSGVSDYVATVKAFDEVEKVYAIELNISCPNVACGGMALGTDPERVYELVKEVRKVCHKPLIVKLSPNVTDIVSIARAAERAGADGLSLINTLLGMRIDLKTGKPIIARKKGGFSGKAIFPIALRMVYDVFEAVNIPLIGGGGVSSAEDVIEMMYAGATLVEVGAANLVDPYACKKIIEDLPRVMEEYKIDDLQSIVGKAHK